MSDPSEKNMGETLAAIVAPKQPEGDKQLFGVAATLAPYVGKSGAPKADPDTLKWLIARCNFLLNNPPA